MSKRKMVKASDCQCCVCGQPAVAFWPVIDPDIPANPYCRPCLDKAKEELVRHIIMEKPQKNR
ncbi:MAG: hypothetical protein IKJ78_06035 [Bacteroidales bacterium]|nr:hypothetical protein [Bacteroidales bacterium]